MLAGEASRWCTPRPPRSGTDDDGSDRARDSARLERPAEGHRRDLCTGRRSFTHGCVPRDVRRRPPAPCPIDVLRPDDWADGTAGGSRTARVGGDCRGRYQAELEKDGDVARRRREVRARSIRLRLIRMTAGFGLLIVGGRSLLILPGPDGSIAAGLAIMSRDVAWAERALARVQARFPERLGRPRAEGRRGGVVVFSWPALLLASGSGGGSSPAGHVGSADDSRDWRRHQRPSVAATLRRGPRLPVLPRLGTPSATRRSAGSAHSRSKMNQAWSSSAWPSTIRPAAMSHSPCSSSAIANR